MKNGICASELKLFDKDIRHEVNVGWTACKAVLASSIQKLRDSMANELTAQANTSRNNGRCQPGKTTVDLWVLVEFIQSMLICPDNEARRGTSSVFNPMALHASAATRMELLQLRSSG